MTPTAGRSLCARDESGQPVDWFFIYKVSKQAHCTTNTKATGTEYVYLDSNGAKAGQPLALSAHRMDQEQGALFHTLNQVYSAGSASPHVGWFFYNDQFPIGKSVGSRGHTKGCLAFNLEDDSAFWLIQSMPNCPLPKRYGFPSTGHEEAQTYLCVTLKGAVWAKKIAEVMYSCHQPNVYAHSHIPPALKTEPGDSRVQLLQNKIATKPGPVAVNVPIDSKGGARFRLFAKNRQWDRDFYNDLVGPGLKEDLEVETWLHHAEPGTMDSDKVHRITVMKSVDLAPIGGTYSWSDAFDHAKLAISHSDAPARWVCVGDINFTTSMRNRGGGTMALQSADLWKELDRILSDREEPTRERVRAGRRAEDAAARATSRRAKTKKPAAGRPIRMKRARAKSAKK